MSSYVKHLLQSLILYFLSNRIATTHTHMLLEFFFSPQSDFFSAQILYVYFTSFFIFLFITKSKFKTDVKTKMYNPCLAKLQYMHIKHITTNFQLELFFLIIYHYNECRNVNSKSRFKGIMIKQKFIFLKNKIKIVWNI